MEKKIRILMLEDNPGDAALIEQTIRDAEISCISLRVETKAEFDQAIREFLPDLILSDYRLPGYDGMQALGMVRENHPDIPVIVLTGALNEETAVECMKAGAADYMLKDRLSRLPQAIIGALGKKKALIERCDAEKALLESEMQYRRLFESSQEGIILIDAASRRITDINPYMLHLVHRKRDEVIGKELWEVGIFQDQQSFAQAFKDLDRSGHVFCEGMVIRTRGDAHANIEMSCNSYPVNSRWSIQCNIRDITQHKRVEEERERMRVQLFQAQKMEAIGTLAGGVAHDFNNLMTAIQVSADVAMMKADDGDLLLRELEEIRHAALRASGLIRQLLLFSRKHLMEFAVLNLNGTVENLLKMLHRLIGEDIEIKTNLDPDLSAVRADAGNMEQVVMNLALNARDAMPKGGLLQIGTENVTFTDQVKQAMPEGRAGHYVCVSVTDTGVGMNEETMHRIFEPFFTTKEVQKGTGLGLAVVYGIVKQHQGWIHVESRPKEGAMFFVYIPAALENVEVEENDQVTVSSLHGGGERILMVEDEDKVREFTSRAIKKCGFSVTATRGVQEALEVFELDRGRFDLLFSDVVLSDQTGIELADEIRKRNPEMKILLCSGYMDHKSQWPLIRQKGYRFLQKPYALPELLQAIHDALSDGSS